MSARTETMLDFQIEHATKGIVDQEEHVQSLRADLKVAEAELGEQQAHLDTLQGLRALTAGRFTLVAPGAIVSDDDVMGLAVGPFRMAPPDGASLPDLQLFAATMRAIYQQGMHQAELANQEVRRREQVSTLETTALPDDIVQQAKDARLRFDLATKLTGDGCANCNEPIYRGQLDNEAWQHQNSDVFCWSPGGAKALPLTYTELLHRRVTVVLASGKYEIGVLTGVRHDALALRVDDVVNDVPIRDFTMSAVDNIVSAPDSDASPFRSFAGPPAYPAESAVPPLPKRVPGEASAAVVEPREMDGTVARPGTLRRVLDGVKRLSVDDRPAAPVIDPDCRDGKCGSCVGGPCEHECHTQQDGDDRG